MLTIREIENLKPRDKTYRVFDGRGLYLEVNAQGGRYWRFKYCFIGREKRLSLGVYPEVSLRTAREKADEARRQVADGIDPGLLRQERKRQAALDAAITFELVGREWWEHRRDGWTPGHADDVLHRLEADVFPRLGTRPISQIRSPELLACLRKIEDRGAMELARRARQVCGQIFRYAIATGRAEINPAEPLCDALKAFKRQHFAAIGAEDLPEFLRALDRNNARLYPQTRIAMRLLLLTFVRTSELIGATWDEFAEDGTEWVIPAERMKMRRPHVVPLSRQAGEILRELRKLTGWSGWLFPNQVHPKKHMSDGTILKALENLGYKGRMTGHGFRALAMSTIKEKLDYRHEVVDRQLAHAPRSKVDAAYDRAAFLGERRRMMQDWADYLERLGDPGRPIRAGLPLRSELAIGEWPKTKDAFDLSDRPLTH
jgi:integrase